jgi:hypothetical protein
LTLDVKANPNLIFEKNLLWPVRGDLCARPTTELIAIMFCRFLLLLALSLKLSEGFGFGNLSLIRIRRPPTRTSLLILSGWFDFNPFHGSGSAKENLDEQWEAQQEILRARRNTGLDKEHLKQKYGAPKKTVAVQIAKDVKPASEEVIQKASSEKKKTPAPFKMPWEK